jgi:cellulose synthase operon protein C
MQTKTLKLIVTVTVWMLSLACGAGGQSTVEQEVVVKARSLEQRGLTDLAAQTWQQVLLSQPNNNEALAGLARAAKKQGKDSEAARYLRLLRKLNPSDPQIPVIESMVSDKQKNALQTQAETMAARGDYPRAMEIYRQLYGQQPPESIALEYYDTEAATEAGRNHAIAGLRELAKAHPGEGPYQVTLGRVLTYSPKTRTEGEATLEQFPQNVAAQNALRQALFWDVQNPAAAAFIKRYLQVHSDQELADRFKAAEAAQLQQAASGTANPGERAAYSALQANQVDQAERGFQSLLDKQPANPRALAGLGFVHMKQGQFAQAVADFEAAKKNGLKDPKIEGGLSTARFWLTMNDATQALNQNQLDLAAQRFREALTLRADSPEALAGLAGTLLRGHQVAEAAVICARWVKVQPNAAPAWRSWFVALAQGGQAQQASALPTRFPPAVKSTLSTDPEYLMNLAAAYRTNGDDAKASETLDRALHLPLAEDGGKITAQLRLQYAALLAATNRPEQAVSLYRQVTAEQPNDAAAWQGLVLAQHQMHDDAGALKTVAGMPHAAYEAARRDPGFLSLVAAALQQQGRLDEAQSLLEEAARMLGQQGQRASIDMEMQLAGIEQQRNHTQDATAIYRRVLDLDPQRAEAWKGLLSTMHQSGEDAQALGELSNIPSPVQSELSTNDDYLLTLSAIYSGAGNNRWALTTLSRLRARYAAQHIATPVDVEIQSSWLWLRSGDEDDLYSTLMGLGGRNDLTDAERAQIQMVWAAWSVRRAARATAAGNSHRALDILNAAREGLAGNDDVSRSLAGGYLTAGDAPSALALYESVELRSSADYQGAIASALAANNLKQTESWLRQALKLYPGDARMLGLAARLEQTRGDNGRALSYWKASLAASADTDVAERLAHTLRAPAVKSKDDRALLPRDRLTSLLNPASISTQHRVLLPGEPSAFPGTVSDADLAPGLAPQSESPQADVYVSPASGGSLGRVEDRPELSAPPGWRPADNEPAELSPKHEVRGANEAGESRSEFAANDIPGVSLIGDPQEAAALALAQAGKRIATTPEGFEPSSKGSTSGTTIHYASAFQSSVPPSEPRSSSADSRVNTLPVAPAPQDGDGLQNLTPGVTDQELVDSHLPPLSRAYSFVQPKQPLNPHQEAQQQIASIDGGLSPWLGGTGYVRHRSGTAGFDRLTAFEAPFETSAPLGTGARLTMITTPVFLDAGIADGTSALAFGSVPVGTIQPQQYADGVANEVQLTTINFAARLGDTPAGFLVSNVGGGVRWRPAGGPLTFNFSREGVKDTQLSYAGLRDPGSATATFDGKIWGGVIANAGDIQLARGGELSGFYVGVGGQYITGQHVLDNTRLHGNAGAYWRILTLPNLGTLVLGANFFGMHYAHNLRYFSYGQGGYFSPEAYFLAAMPISWTGHYGTDLHYTVNASIGAQSFQENSEPYFPLDAQLQAAFHDPLVPVRASVGANYDLQSEIAYRLQDHWYVGGFLAFNNTQDYESQRGGFFVRYLFRPQPDSETGPIGAFPREGFRPVVIP